MGHVFPEILEKRRVQEIIRVEEEAFNKTLDRGIELFREETECMSSGGRLHGDFAFKLYDTHADFRWI